MNWKTYYKLLVKYDGDLSRAPNQKLIAADRLNGHETFEALRIARQKYETRKKIEEVKNQITTVQPKDNYARCEADYLQRLAESL